MLRRVPNILVAGLIYVSTLTSAQTRYALRQIDFQDPANSALCKPNTDNLAVILVDAYLNGKLTAYKTGPLDSLIQSLEFPKRSLREVKTPTARKKRFERKGKARSNANVMVTAADLKALTKSEFLQEMLIVEDGNETVQWDKSTRYERGKGLVFSKGLGYFPKKDTVGIPPPNKTYWELAYNANVPFYFRIPDLPAIEVFGQYIQVDKKDVWQPLLIRVMRTAEVPDYLVDMSVSFKYEEVMNYLAGIGQPLLFKTQTGFVGNGAFVLDEEERNYLKDQVRSQATSNATFKSNIAITSTVIFSSFLDQSDKDPLCTFFQDPASKEFRLFKQNVPIATIPTGAIEQMLSFPKPELFTWSQALSQNMFKNFEIQLNGVTSDLRYVEVTASVANPAPRAGFFLEKYTVNTTGAVEQKRLRLRFTNLIKFVNAQFKAGTLLLAEERDSYFRARFDWSTLPEIKAMGTAVGKNYWSNLLHHDDVSDVRYPYYWSDNSNISYLHKKLSPLRADSLEFGVTYRRVLVPAKGKSPFEPLQVSLRSTQKPAADGNDMPTYTLNWIDFKKAVLKGKDPLLVELVKLAETGDLPYTESSIVYGLIEETVVPTIVASPGKGPAKKK